MSSVMLLKCKQRGTLTEVCPKIRRNRPQKKEAVTSTKFVKKNIKRQSLHTSRLLTQQKTKDKTEHFSQFKFSSSLSKYILFISLHIHPLQLMQKLTTKHFAYSTPPPPRYHCCTLCKMELGKTHLMPNRAKPMFKTSWATTEEIKRWCGVKVDNNFGTAQTWKRTHIMGTDVVENAGKM